MLTLLPDHTIKNNKIDHNHFFEWISVRLLLICLIVSSVGNQQIDSPVSMFLGQISGWFSLIFGLSVIINFYHHKRLFVLLFLSLIFARVLRIAFGDMLLLQAFYTIFLAIFYCSASAALIIKYPMTTIKIIRWICYISIPLMLIQTMGIGEWSHYLRTDDHGTGSRQFSSLFAEFGAIPLTTFQTRPSGFFHANNLLSLFSAFACIFQMVTIRNRNIYPSDIPIFLVAILSMSKFVFILLVLIFLRQILFANLDQKYRAFKLFILSLLLLSIYSILFPAFFEYNLSLQNYYLGIMIRFYDILNALGGIQSAGVLLDNALGGTTLYTLTGSQSGYALLFSLPKEIWVVMFVLIFILLRQFMKRIEDLKSYERDIAILSLMLFATMPAITGFLTAPLFWFFCGGICMPFIFYKVSY